MEYYTRRYLHSTLLKQDNDYSLCVSCEFVEHVCMVACNHVSSNHHAYLNAVLIVRYSLQSTQTLTELGSSGSVLALVFETAANNWEETMGGGDFINVGSSALNFRNGNVALFSG